jgi:hypothetical protein
MPSERGWRRCESVPQLAAVGEDLDYIGRRVNSDRVMKWENRVSDSESSQDGAVGIDIAIICALEEEREQVCRVFGLNDRSRTFRNGQRYWAGLVTRAAGDEVSIVVAQLNDMANPASALGTVETEFNARTHVALPGAQ